MPVFLGFDSSTQGLTAIAIEVDEGVRRVVWQHVLPYDQTFPQYGTRHGVLPSDDPSIAHSSPAMWAEALDRMMEIAAKNASFDLADVVAVSGSAQQHGSVYLNATATKTLATLDPSRPLSAQIDGIWARPTSPIWMDTSTSEECAAITRAVGGAGVLARLTGSRAFERFTGPQIRKFAREEPDAYTRTDRIHLVSSFLASLLVGDHAPLEPGDASGMNLMSLADRRWAPVAVEATAEHLASKLPGIVPSWTVVGRLSPYWTGRYGLPPANVIAWTGDNPSSLIGTGLVREGSVAVSLGTSDTIFGAMDVPRVDPSGTGHVFGAPTGRYMGLTCFANGSLARERVRDQFGLDWTGFAHALRESPAGNGGALMLPWFEPEITPRVQEQGARTRNLDSMDARANVRAVVEGQMMAMRRHSWWMGVPIETIHATGGAAVTREILQIMADVFDAEVRVFDVVNSTALGAALRAWHADALDAGTPVSWDEVVDAFVKPAAGRTVLPVRAHAAIYAALLPRQAEFEANQLNERR